MIYQQLCLNKLSGPGLLEVTCFFPSRRAEKKRPAMTGMAGVFMGFPLPQRLGESVEPVVFAIVRDFFTEAGSKERTCGPFPAPFGVLAL